MNKILFLFLAAATFLSCKKSGINTYTVDRTVSNNQINTGGITSGNWSGVRTY
jgi:hypothetical protein